MTAASSSCTHSATVLILQPARQIDQRLHEGAIVRRARDVLHEGAVDLHDVDAELAQIAERGVAGAEIVDRDPAAEVLQPRDEAAQIVDILDRDGFGDFDDQPLGDAGMRVHQRFDRGPPVRIHRGIGRDVEAELHVRRRGQFRHHEFEHAVIDQADQAEPLRHRNDVGRQQHLAVVLLHADQALVERRIARARLHHRLERHHDAALVERGDDLVGDADIDPALGVALDIRTPHRERSGAAALGAYRAFHGRG